MAAMQKYALALFGQSALSGFNFALNVLLVRHLDARDYGAYALSLIVATLATSVSAALACSPLVRW